MSNDGKPDTSAPNTRLLHLSSRGANFAHGAPPQTCLHYLQERVALGEGKHMSGLIGVDPALLGLSSAIQCATAGTMAGTTACAAPQVAMVLPPAAHPAPGAAAGGLTAAVPAPLAPLTQ